MKVVLYSNGCPRCRVLKQKLDDKGVVYAEENSVELMLTLGITQVPVLVVDGKFLPFAAAMEWTKDFNDEEVV